MFNYDQYRTSQTPPLALVANTYQTLFRASEQRVGFILPAIGGATFNLDYAEPAFAVDGFTFSNINAPIVIHKCFWGDIVKRAISIKSSIGVTIRVLEILDHGIKT